MQAMDLLRQISLEKVDEEPWVELNEYRIFELLIFGLLMSIDLYLLCLRLHHLLHR